ncbi:PucR family transcriptional regulator [Desulfotomaculum sp. 1211_IL3151]|uniref:PucR family transcriptional regulator n=1 Tax=Desulfotomaculum sp. 1211_IL3151 TaxID=3084055 RepID=UPI002FD9AF6F
MGVSIRDALTLDVLKDAQIIAGQRGFDKLIKRVSVVECPDCEDYKGLLREGDFFLTSFYAVKDDPACLAMTVKTLIESGSSGLCVLDLYMTDLPEEIKVMADRKRYPILMVSRDLPYAEIITEIMDLIIQNKENIIIEMQVDKLLLEKDIHNLRGLARQINPKFQEYVAAVYCTGKKGICRLTSKLRESFKELPGWSLLSYKDGILILISTPKQLEHSHLIKEQNYLSQTIEGYVKEFNLGISRHYRGLESLGICIKEALHANSLGEKVLGQKITNYKDLGVYRILSVVKEAPEVKEFHDEMILPLQEYDSKSNTNLFKTALSYIENDGDVNKTAQELFQHKNTIRYRLTKIKEILNMEGLEGSFYEQLAVAVKIHKMR